MAGHEHHVHHPTTAPPSANPALSIRGNSTNVSNNQGHSSYSSLPMHQGMHPMAFHFGSKEMILFEFWNVDSTYGMIVSCFLVVVLCFLMECMRWYRLYRKKEQWSEAQYQAIPRSFVKRIDSNVLSDGVLHAIQLTISYALMLIFMTFNVWLCLAIVIGEVLARAFFTVLFPQLERMNEFISMSETCCG